MATNRNNTLAERSTQTPARFNRRFARALWRHTFESPIAFARSRQRGRDNSFALFTGRNPAVWA